jgi:hypothetical protein
MRLALGLVDSKVVPGSPPAKWEEVVKRAR